MQILDAQYHRPLEGGLTFPLRFLVFRTVWNVSWTLLAAWTPPPFYAWRRFILRLFGGKVSETARFYGNTRIWHPANVELGEFVQIGRGAFLYSMAKITLDDYSIVSQGAQLCAGTHDIESPQFQTIAKSIRIGRRAWVASEAFVGPGVTIAEGAILGARGVAFGDLASWTVYAGNPAKPIKTRTIRSSEPTL